MAHHSKKHHAKVLFICKRRSYGVSYGLINSCQFVCNALSKHKIECKVVHVTDANDIDREVTAYKPTHVIIEALWVVPNKFNELHKLHPHIKWVVRIHSKAPFLSVEGVAMEWIKEYLTMNKQHVYVAINNEEFYQDLKRLFPHEIFHHDHLLYLPNIYEPDDTSSPERRMHKGDHIKVGCFGAIRQQKNQMVQAIAAIEYANKHKKHLSFHMNSPMIELQDSAILKNIQRIFAGSKHELILHDWMPHEHFIKLVQTMDIGMQVSFSESFCIIAADFVWNNIPIVASDEIKWINSIFNVYNPADTSLIVDRMEFALDYETLRSQNLLHINKHNLIEYNKRSESAWIDHLK